MIMSFEFLEEKRVQSRPFLIIEKAYQTDRQLEYLIIPGVWKPRDPIRKR